MDSTFFETLDQHFKNIFSLSFFFGDGEHRAAAHGAGRGNGSGGGCSARSKVWRHEAAAVAREQGGWSGAARGEGAEVAG